MTKIIKIFIILKLILLSSHAFSYQDFNILKAEVTGRAVILDNNIEKARRLALEDALYLSSLVDTRRFIKYKVRRNCWFSGRERVRENIFRKGGDRINTYFVRFNLL